MNRSGAIAAIALLLALSVSSCGGRGRVDRIIVVTFDTTRADHIGCYGDEQAHTPNLDGLADDGVLFEQATSAIPTTLPAHSTMFTGLYPQDHGVRYNLRYTLGPEATTLAERLRDAGWATAGLPASFVVAGKYGLNQGFDLYVEPPEPDRGSAHSTESMRPADAGVDQLVEWLDGQPSGKRVFAWLHFYDPHWPYDPPFPWSSQFRDRPYDGEIAFADAQLGRLLDRLRGDGRWDRTAILVLGDHGEGLYDHDERYHTHLIYQTTQHVPMIVHAPGASAHRVGEPVTIADVTPTVLDLAELPLPDGLRGISLLPALHGESPPRRDLYMETLAGTLSYGWAEVHGLRDGRWKLIDSGTPELYDLEDDPGETRDLANLEPERTQELEAALRELSEPIGGAPTAVDADAPVLDAETEAFLASLGYVGGSGGAAPDAARPRDMIYLEPELLDAQGAVFTQDWDRVDDVCRYVLERDPKNRWALATLVHALLQTDQAKEAQDIGAEMVRIYPDNELSYVRFAESYDGTGDHARANEIIRQGLKAIPDSRRLRYFDLVTAFDAKQQGVCTSLVPAAVADYPDVASMRLMVARCALAAGETRDALEALGEAVRRGFRDFDSLLETDDFATLAEDPRFLYLRRLVEEGSEQGGSS